MPIHKLNPELKKGTRCCRMNLLDSILSKDSKKGDALTHSEEFIIDLCVLIRPQQRESGTGCFKIQVSNDQ